MNAKRVKANGIHYTPPGLADFLANSLVNHLRTSASTIEVLDPACGEGELLFAFAAAFPKKLRERLTLVGYETDEQALRAATSRFQGVDSFSIQFKKQDFLETSHDDLAIRPRQREFFNSEVQREPRRFDVIIANPPYVRTQVLGAAKAQSLASRFGLSGRVDLYHAFVKGMTNVLKPGGMLGLLTSNRFLTIRSGAALRELLSTDMTPRAIFDLGDTKLFAAAVLPVIVIAEKTQRTHDSSCSFQRVYEHRGVDPANVKTRERASVLDALRSHSKTGLVHTAQGAFNLESGALAIQGVDKVWSLATPESERWLRQVAARGSRTFEDVGEIRVGIKTTADDVFIRDDWQSLPVEERPESKLLRPLIRHFNAERWTWSGRTRQSVLYPHMVRNGRRMPIQLGEYPRAKQYLLRHRERLERRHYVIDSGRQWYEIWVPHGPLEWAKPKLVFPDISEQPRFFFDPSGATVNGECYWITLREGMDSRYLMLMLAVANSTFITRYYDIAFHNKLYSGRRRFQTQFVRKFPLPSLECKAAREAVELVQMNVNIGRVDVATEDQLDALVWKSFGLAKEILG